MELIRQHRRTPDGFTLIELLVVTGIIVVITAVVFAGQGNFNSSVLLSSTAYDVALSLSDAQTYGLGTRSVSGVSNAGYGLDFKKATPATYTFFADSYPLPGGPGACHPLPVNGATAPNAYGGNCIYDGSDAVVSTFNLGNHITISDFCAYNGSWSCANSGNQQLTQLDIVYVRPNAIVFMAVNGAYAATPVVTQACLKLSSAQGTSRYVKVANTGQIIASATSCP